MKVSNSRCLIRSLVAMLSLFAFASNVPAEIPAGTDLPTIAQLNAKQIVFEAAQSIDVYKANEGRNKTFDDRVLAFMGRVTRDFIERPSGPVPVDLEREGRMISLDGCDDPLFESLYGRILLGMDHRAAAEPFLRRAMAGMIKAGYSQRHLAYTIKKLRDLREEDQGGEDVEKLEMRLIEAVVGALGEGIYPKGDRQMLVRDLEFWQAKISHHSLEQMVRGIKGIKDMDPVVMDLEEGVYQLNAAWESRGGDWSHLVTPGRWKEFSRRLPLAREALTKAWAADPSLVQAPRAMITVCKGEDRADEARIWFDRAVKARFDDESTYNNYLAVLLPRWGGSIDKIYSLGMECAGTGRFDTRVPFYFFNALAMIRNESHGGFEKWKDLDAFPLLKAVLQKMANHPAHQSNAGFYLSLLAASAVQTGHFDDARAVVERPGFKLDPAPLREMNLSPQDVREMAFAFSGPNTAGALKALELANEKNLAEAADAFTKAASANSNPEGARHLRSRAIALRWQIDFEAGKEVALNIDKDLSGWHAEQGQFEGDEKTGITARPDDRSIQIRCLAAFGRDWELSFGVHFVKVTHDRVDAGVLMLADRTGWVHSVRLYRRLGAIKAEPGINNDEKPTRVKIGDNNQVRVISQEGKVTIWLNDKEVEVDKTIPEYAPDDELHIGFGAMETQRGDILRFDGIKIKKRAE